MSERITRRRFLKHQAVYTVPAGRVTLSPDYPLPILADLKVIQAKDYFRHPPFTPVAATK